MAAFHDGARQRFGKIFSANGTKPCPREDEDTLHGWALSIGDGFIYSAPGQGSCWSTLEASAKSRFEKAVLAMAIAQIKKQYFNAEAPLYNA